MPANKKPVTLATPVLLADNAIPNIHPVDELQSLREEISQMTARADEIRDGLLAEGADLKGDMYSANIIPGKRETLDRKALTEAFGEAMLAPYIRTTYYRTVKLVEN